MGSSESDTPVKTPKTTASQETPPATSVASTAAAVYPDWSGFQAYSPIPPPHGFFHSPVASSPQAHPYMWGAQHIMPPYGTPPPPYVMYPHGGLYAHPSVPPGSHPFSPYALPSPINTAEPSGPMPGGIEVDGKSPEGNKEKCPIKRSKGSLGSLNMITGKSNNDLGKSSGTSANGVFSQSGASASEGSSEGSDANSQNDLQPKTGGGQDSFEEASQNGMTSHDSQNGIAPAPSQPASNQTMSIMPMPATGTPAAVVGPTTNLNIGMDYWGTPAPSTVAPICGKVPPATVPGAMVSGGFVGSRENMPSELWLQDERELKRQRRKQSNRESARRSRLRKQAECEELAQRVEVLKEENSTLLAEVERIKKEYDQLLAKNNSLKEKLGERTEDSRPEKKDQNAVDDNQKQLDTDAQMGKTDPGKSGR